MDSKIKKHATIKKFFISVPIFLAIMLILAQCTDINAYKDTNDCDYTDVDDCDYPDTDGYNCLGVFVSVGLLLRHPNGQPVLLDRSSVFWVSENRFLEQNPFWWNSARQWGNYIVVDDNMQRELRGRQEIMRFTGYIDDEIVFERDLLVSAGPCHVKYLGTEPLTVVVEGISDAIQDREFCELLNTECIFDLIPLVTVVLSSIDDDVSHEDSLQMIVDWLLSRSCIIDAYIDCILCVSANPEWADTDLGWGYNSRIAFSFVENGKTVNMGMLVSGCNASFLGFIFK